MSFFFSETIKWTKRLGLLYETSKVLVLSGKVINFSYQTLEWWEVRLGLQSRLEINPFRKWAIVWLEHQLIVGVFIRTRCYLPDYGFTSLLKRARRNQNYSPITVFLKAKNLYVIKIVCLKAKGYSENARWGFTTGIIRLFALGRSTCLFGVVNYRCYWFGPLFKKARKFS